MHVCGFYSRQESSSSIWHLRHVQSQVTDLNNAAFSLSTDCIIVADAALLVKFNISLQTLQVWHENTGRSTRGDKHTLTHHKNTDRQAEHTRTKYDSPALIPALMTTHRHTHTLLTHSRAIFDQYSAVLLPACFAEGVLTGQSQQGIPPDDL